MDALLVAQSAGQIHIRQSNHDSALRKALLSHRVVGNDGVVGGELVTALALAVKSRPPARARVM